MPTYKRLSITALLILAAVLFSGWVNAGDVTFTASWTAPTTRTDGTVLDPADILEYRVYHAVDAEVVRGAVYTSVSGENQAPVSITLMPSPTPYTVNYAVTAVTKMRDLNGNYLFDDLLQHLPGEESALSNVGRKIFMVFSNAAPEIPTQIDLNVTSCDGCIVVEQ